MTDATVKITDEMVEAAAQALRIAFLPRPVRREWHELLEVSRRRYRVEARACIEAALKTAKDE